MAESSPSRRFIAAAVQAPPVSFDAEATLSKAVDLGHSSSIAGHRPDPFEEDASDPITRA